MEEQKVKIRDSGIWAIVLILVAIVFALSDIVSHLQMIADKCIK